MAELNEEAFWMKFIAISLARGLTRLIACLAISNIAGASPNPVRPPLQLSMSAVIGATEVVSADKSGDVNIPNAITLFNAGRYDLSIPIVKKLVSNLPDTDPNIALLLDLLGESYRHSGEFEKADRAFERAISILKAHNNTSSPSYEPLIGDLATSLYEEGRFEESKPLLEQSITILESNKDNIRLANRLNTEGALLQRTGKTEAAEGTYKRALDLFGDDPARVEVLNNLGALAMGRGHYNAAEDIYNQSLRIVRQAQSSKVSDIAHAELGLGVVYELSGDNTEAETLYRSALTRLLHAPTQEDLLIAHVQSDLGEVLLRQGRFAEAEENLNNARSLG
jgi:tetratricopeptide (TPR) repeat protein